MGRGVLALLGLLVSLTTSHDMGPHLTAPEAPASTAVADDAPDFVLATAWGWHSFQEVHEGRPVVLVFEAEDTVLVSLERELPWFETRGVDVAAVTRDSDGANWDRIERLGLHYALYSDPRGQLAGLYGLGKPRPAWCLVDAEGHVTELQPGLGAGLVAEIRRSLPAPSSAAGDAMR
jgi:peroxiredoxin